jgi:hypothetical protein
MRDDTTRARRTLTTTSGVPVRTPLEHWRQTTRPHVVRALVQQTMGLRWSRRLLRVLLEELYVGDEGAGLIKNARRLAPEHAAQAVALHLIARHSWTPHDLAHLARRLQLSITPATSESTGPASRTPGLRPSRTSALRRTRVARDSRPGRRRS